jgi:phenylacetate-coenzyme A ligase PaaK-like adenylate-forming protein
MPSISVRAKLRGRLASDPALANRLLHLLGAKRVERIAQRNAIRAAQDAYTHVPYYRSHYEAHGFDARRMKRLDWAGFLSLPVVSKETTADVEDRDLLDQRLAFLGDDAVVGLSSGTTWRPVTWPVGWDEFYTLRAIFRQALRKLAADHQPTAVILIMGADGMDLAANITYRAFYSLKEELHWPFEVFVMGESPADVARLLKWLEKRTVDSLLMCAFPGMFERTLDELGAAPETHDLWSRFRRKKIFLGGHQVTTHLQERIRSALALEHAPVDSLEILYIASETGQAIAHSTPFAAWLQRYLAEHPDLYDAIGLDPAHRSKAILEFVPSLSMYVEPHSDGADGALLTTWKHRPLVRYASHDLIWARSARDVTRLLNKHAKRWRRDFRRHGYGRRYVPSGTQIGVVLGRADDVRIVNGANISPGILEHALELTGIRPHIHHFKHDTRDDAPLTYYVYLELPDTADQERIHTLEEEWRPRLREALITMPEVGPVLVAPFQKAFDLQLVVRPRGADEFAGDDLLTKRPYVPGRRA